MADECVFCRIAGGQIPAEVVVDRPGVLVFRDIRPATPVHCLAIPKKHIATLNDMSAEDGPLLGELMAAVAEAARKLGVAERGYRVVANVNREAGQEVFHVHFHLLAGRQFGWPPG
jgi:histidine triad (HIT) family protein